MNFSTVRKSGDWSARCDSWLAQFAEQERDTAELLLDSITYITHEDLCAALHAAVDELATSLLGACALYPVTNTKKFRDFQSYSHLPFGVDGDLGGEGDLGHLCRDISENRKHNNAVHAFPPLKQLQSRKIRHIILITDSTSSGKQGFDFLDWMWTCRTIRSWHSGKLIQFHYVTYLYELDSKDTIDAHASKPTFHGLQSAVHGHPDWTTHEKCAIDSLCRRYGSSRTALGYEDMMSLQVFSYSCPNNVPSILRFGNTHRGCRGLFERRPTRVSGHAIAGVDANLQAVADRIGLIVATPVAVICDALQKRPASAELLSARLGLPLVVINNGLNEAMNADYARPLKAAYRLTPTGVRFVRSLERKPREQRDAAIPLGAQFDYLPMPRSPVNSSSNNSVQSESPNG